MTSRERVLAAMRRRRTDRVPFDFSWGFTPPALDRFRQRTGHHDPDEYFGTDTRIVRLGPTRLATDFSAYHGDLPPGTRLDEWGTGHQPTSSDEADHQHLDGFVYPMRGCSTPRDAAAYPLPDLEADYRYEPVAQAIAAIHDRGLAALAAIDCTVFEVAWYLRGMEALLMDMVDNPGFAEVLFDRITAKREVQAARYAELGADVLCYGDDVGTQRGMLMSPTMWRRWLKPRLARTIAAARRVRPDVLVFYHSDGDIRPIVGDLVEIGVEILNPVQPECMDPAALKRQFGDRLSFWGTIGTQTTLPFGTPSEVREEVRLRIATVGTGGGLFLAPTHFVEPEVPHENLVAMADAIREFADA